MQNRHVPGSQPPFSLIPDPDQNKEDTFLLCLWRLYPPLTSDSILSFTKPKFREKCLRSRRSCGNLDSRSEWVLPIFIGFKSFHQRNPGHIKHHLVLPEFTFRDKTPQGMEHVRCSVFVCQKFVSKCSQENDSQIL